MKMYNNPTWTERVMFMPDNQVMAIYYSSLKSGRLEAMNRRVKKEYKKEYQTTIYDYIPDKEVKK